MNSEQSVVPDWMGVYVSSDQRWASKYNAFDRRSNKRGIDDKDNKRSRWEQADKVYDEYPRRLDV